jgi:hypothetical protein
LNEILQYACADELEEPEDWDASETASSTSESDEFDSGNKDSKLRGDEKRMEDDEEATSVG